MTKVRVEGDVTTNQVAVIADAVSNESAGQVTVSPGKNLITTKSFGIVESATIVGGIASIVSLVIVLTDKYKNTTQKDEWSVDRIRKIIDVEMALRNVTSIEIDSIDGFGNLIGQRPGACSVIVKDVKSKRSYRIDIYRDGDTYVFKIER